MVERGEHPRLALEARETIRIGGKGGGKDLDRDVAIELRVTGPVDLAHSACPDWTDDLVGVEPRPGDQWHVLVALPRA